MKGLREMKSKACIELNRIPDFINSTSVIHYGIWNKLTLCNNLIYSMITDKVLSKGTVEKLCIKFDTYIDEVIDNLTPKEQLLLAAYYNNIFDYIMEESERIEAYEICANITKFYDIYNNNSTENN